MSQDFLDETELPEEDLLDEDEEITSSEKHYIPLSTQGKLLEQMPLAFTVPHDLEPVVSEGCTLAWTTTALATFAEIRNATRSNGQSSVKNLPYASLRGLLEVGLKNATRIQSCVGLSKYELNSITNKPFAYLMDDSEADVRKTLRPLLNDWFANYLMPFTEREKVPTKLLERLEDLQIQGLLTISLFNHTLPWGWSPETGTTLPKDKHAYRTLADCVARQIAGQEIFKGLGPMKRIISSSGDLTSGVAELITAPFALPDKKGKFSLLVRVEIVTYPSVNQPVLKIDVSKRRWLSRLKAPNFDRSNISGFVFSRDYSDRAFSYWVVSRQDKDNKPSKNDEQSKNKTYRWVADTDFEILKRDFQLPLSSADGQQIALGKANTDRCEVMLTYRNGLQDNLEEDEDSVKEYGIEAGVPETDKLEAFEKITNILKPLKLHPFKAYSLVNSSHSLDGTASRMINLPTLLGAVLEVLETKTDPEFTTKYLDQFNDGELDNLLRKHFCFGLGEIDKGRKLLKFSRDSLDQTKDLQALVQANQAAMRRIYPNEPLSLFIFHEPQLQTEAKLLQAVIQVLWADTLEILLNSLPLNTHGSRDELPDKELTSKGRSDSRLKAWKHTAQQLEERKQRTFCLIVARKFFCDHNDQTKTKCDDRVNKPSTRQALASRAGACSQFLEPIAKTRKTKRFILDKFFHRMQSALKDLLSAHSGRVDHLQEKVDKYLAKIPPEKRPKEIIGITIVRKQKGRARGFIGNTFLPIATRIQVDTGKHEMCCAYQKGNALTISPWSSLPDAIAFISRISPVKLADKQEVAINRFMEFVKQVISNSVADGAQPLVLIDSSNCVQLWNWLADSRMNANQINLGQQYQWMEKEWQGARLIRIRQDLAPGIIDKKVRQYVETTLDDARSKKELKKLTPLQIPYATSSRQLLRLMGGKETGCVAYLSVGDKTFHHYSRGQSCYRSTKIHIPVKTEDSSKNVCNKAELVVYQVGNRPPFTGHWATPNPLEIVTTLRQLEDNPDDLAALVESLRYGFGHYREWTALPAPLFFERVVRDYISDFALEDENTETDID